MQTHAQTCWCCALQCAAGQWNVGGPPCSDVSHTSVSMYVALTRLCACMSYVTCLDVYTCTCACAWTVVTWASVHERVCERGFTCLYTCIFTCTRREQFNAHLMCCAFRCLYRATCSHTRLQTRRYSSPNPASVAHMKPLLGMITPVSYVLLQPKNLDAGTQ